PQRRGLAAGERGVQALVERPVQPAVAAAAEGVHHHHDRLLAVLALVPLAPPRLAAAGLPPGPAPVPLAAAGTAPPPGPAAGRARRRPRRLASPASVAVGGHVPSTSITSPSPSGRGGGSCLRKGAACRPRPSTTRSIVSVAGDQPSAARQTERAAAKLMRVASRATHCISQGESRSAVRPRATSSGQQP